MRSCLPYVMVLVCEALATDAAAQTNSLVPRCFEERIASENMGPLMGIAQGDARQIIEQVVAAVGLTADEIVVKNCGYVENAVAWVPPLGSSVPRARYIAYNEDWMRLAAGRDRWQAVAVLGHELGHFVAGHFFENAGLSTRVKEAQADRYAGCAVARLRGPWNSVEEVLHKIRSPTGGEYPSLSESLESAISGFNGCSEKRYSGHPVEICSGDYILYDGQAPLEVNCSYSNNYCSSISMFNKVTREFVYCE